MPTRKGKAPSKKQPPTEHPKPYKSVLWDHFDTIQKLRRRRESWRGIADHLNQAHQLAVSYKTIQRFFKRASDPKTGKLKSLPLGFTGVPTGTEEEAAAERPKQSSRERLRAEAASLEKKTKEREAKWKFTSPYQDKPARKK
jgi:hypothetical protein